MLEPLIIWVGSKDENTSVQCILCQENGGEEMEH